MRFGILEHQPQCFNTFCIDPSQRARIDYRAKHLTISSYLFPVLVLLTNEPCKLLVLIKAPITLVRFQALRTERITGKAADTLSN